MFAADGGDEVDVDGCEEVACCGAGGYDEVVLVGGRLVRGALGKGDGEGEDGSDG